MSKKNKKNSMMKHRCVDVIDNDIRFDLDVSKSVEAIAVSIEKVQSLITEIPPVSGQEIQSINQMATAVAQMKKKVKKGSLRTKRFGTEDDFIMQIGELAGMVAQCVITNATNTQAWQGIDR
jgi:hypothetical protein